MGVMRRNLFLVLALFTALCISVRADVTPAEQTSPEYVINNGYSEATAEEVMILKNRALAQPTEPLCDRKHNKFVRFCQKWYSYLEPAVDNQERFHHDIMQSPSPRDL